MEHFPKFHCEKLLEELQSVAERVIVLKSSSFFKQSRSHVEHNLFQAYVGHWNVKDFNIRGYNARSVGNFAMEKLTFQLEN
jgi:hypothetical protein